MRSSVLVVVDVEQCRKELRLCSRWSQHDRQSAIVMSSLDSLQLQLCALCRDTDKLHPDATNLLVSTLCLNLR